MPTREDKPVAPQMPGLAPRGPGRGFGGGMHGAPVVKPRDFRKTAAQIWGFFGGARKMLLLVAAMVLADCGIGLLTPWLISRAIDTMKVVPGSLNKDLLTMILSGLALSYAADAVLTFFQNFTMAGVTRRMVTNLREAVFAKLQKLPVTFFDSHPHGELMSRLSNDVDNISSTVAQSTTQLMNNAVMITGSLVMMLIMSPLLTLAATVTIPLIFLLTRLVTKKTRPLFKQQQAMLGQLNGHIEETVSGMAVVRGFGREHAVMRDFEELNESMCNIGTRAQIMSGLMMPLMNVINNIGFAAVAGAGGLLAIQGSVSVGMIAGFLTYSRQFVRPLNEVANIWNTLQTAVAGAERVFQIMDAREEAEDVQGAEDPGRPRGAVRFENVTFEYRQGVPVLRGVDMDIPEGTVVALVGATGSGKTTMVNLLTRFYDVTGGKILLDGRDIRELARDGLRRCFGIVLQDTCLFAGTIRENLRYGRLDATDEDIRKAAEMARADGFIRRLPDGYDTLLTESGGNLSQGQRQLLTIARALLADPAILILDEATSSVDTRTELRIQEALVHLMKGRTSFIIAHRLSTIREADVILVMDGGRIVERGSHESLMADAGGVYHRLFMSQLRHIAT